MIVFLDFLMNIEDVKKKEQELHQDYLRDIESAIERIKEGVGVPFLPQLKTLDGTFYSLLDTRTDDLGELLLMKREYSLFSENGYVGSSELLNLAHSDFLEAANLSLAFLAALAALTALSLVRLSTLAAESLALCFELKLYCRFFVSAIFSTMNKVEVPQGHPQLLSL